MEKVLRILVIALFAVALVASTGQPARAAEEGMKGLGISGYVDAVGAYSRTASDYLGGTIAPGLYGGTATLNTNPTGRDESDFTFAGTELKLHFNRDFGDKAFAVGSLSLQSAAASGGASSTGQFNFDVQQAAVGLKFGDTHLLLGRFYAPIGIESVDANSRATATLGNVFAGLEPFYLTGAMLHYAPEEGVGGFIFGANNIQDFNDEGSGIQSINNAKALGVGVTLVSGDVSGTLQYNVDWSNGTTADAFEDATQLVDLSILMDNDQMLGGIDAIYRHENVGTASVGIFGIEALVGAKIDDITIGIRGEFIKIDDDEVPGTIAGAAPGAIFSDGKVYAFTPFVTYTVTDGVFARLEYRADITDYTGVDKSNTQTVIAQLNASFE